MVPEICPHLLLYQRITFVYEYLDLHVQLNLVMYKTQSKRLMIFLRIFFFIFFYYFFFYVFKLTGITNAEKFNDLYKIYTRI